MPSESLKANPSFQKQPKNMNETGGSFFLTGPIWARTVFCIDIGNIVLINEVKKHLPHMYMIFVERQRKQPFVSLVSQALSLKFFASVPPS